MACDYKESCSKACTLLCIALWAFPLMLTLHFMHSNLETAFANDPMHACDNLIHTPAKCNHIERSAETSPHRNLSKLDVYWNTSTSRYNLTKSEISPFQTQNGIQQLRTTSSNPTATGNPIDSGLIWMMTMCCLSIMLDDLIPALFSGTFRQPKICDPKYERNRTTITSSPLLRLCRMIILIFACIIAVNQGLPLWNMPKLEDAPRLRKRRLHDSRAGGFASEGVFLKSANPQQVVRTLATIGDGNCFWRAVARNLPIKWYTLKHRVLRSALQDPANLENKGIKLLMKKNQWANSLAIQLTAKFLDCNLAVWHRGGIGFFPSSTQHASTICLALSHHHFESISAKAGMKLLATCDPHSPIPIQALSYCTGTDYPEGITVPCRTLKIGRVGYFKVLSFTPPSAFACPNNIGLGLSVRETPLPSHRTSLSEISSQRQSRKGKTRQTGGQHRHAWPFWYLVLMLLLHCIGIETPAPRSSFNPDLRPFNLSSFTIGCPILPHAEFQESYRPTQPISITRRPWTHEEFPATQSSSRTVAFGAEEVQHVLDTCSGCKETCKQWWPDCNCSKVCPNHLNAPHPIPSFRPLDPHNTLHFIGGFSIGTTISPAAMVVTKAEVLLEQQLRSLRSQMDSGEAASNRDTYQGLHQRHQAVVRALQTKRAARERSKTPIRRRTRREINRLVRGQADGTNNERHEAALEQPMAPLSAAPAPPPWIRTTPAMRQEILIETMGTNPDRAMAPSAFQGQADVVLQMRLHRHQDPGRNYELHAHSGMHQATLRRVAGSPTMQRALSAILENCTHKRRIFVEIQCKQGRHRSVAAAECLQQLFRVKDPNVVVEVHHRGAQNNWYTLCQAGTCVDCNMYKAQGYEGLGLRAELHAVLSPSPCLTMQVTEHPYVFVGERRSYMVGIAQPSCYDTQNVTCNLTWPQDGGGAHPEDALEHPHFSAIPAFTGGYQLKITLSYPNCLSPYFPDPFLNCCFPDHSIRSSLNLLGKDDAIQLQGQSLKKLRCLDDHCRLKYFNLGYLTKSNALLPNARLYLLACPPVIQFNLDRQSSEDPPNDPQKDHTSEANWFCPAHLTFHSCHNSGSGDEAITGRNTIPCGYDGTPLLRIKGLPKNPYGVHLSGGCVGAVLTPEGDHCKSPRNGSPKPFFGFLGSLVSRLLLVAEHLCNPGFTGLCYKEWLWQSSCATTSAENRPLDAWDMMHAYAVACTNSNQHDITNAEADFCLEAPSTCDFHLDAFQTLKPPVQGSSKFICDPHLFIGGSCLQSRNHSKSAYHLIHLAMDLSPQELQLERDLRRMRNEMDSGEVRTDSGRWNYLLAQMRLSNGERLAHRAERQQDVPARDRSRSPILRRTRAVEAADAW